MQLLDRAGTFRGTPVDWGVSETTKGYPQLVVKFAVTEMYNTETEKFVSWSDYEQEITAYLVLFTFEADGTPKELLNAKQVKTVFSWDGLSFESLANGSYGDLTVLFRVDENEYNGQTRLQVNWIDAADADPVRQLPKYDAAKLKDMTAKFSGALAGTATSTPPAKAPAKAKRSKRAKPGPKPKADPTPTANAAPPATPVMAAPTPAAPSGPAPPDPETKASAWETVNAASDRTDDDLATLWIAAVEKIGKDEGEFTPEDWTQVRHTVLESLSIPF